MSKKLPRLAKLAKRVAGTLLLVAHSALASEFQIERQGNSLLVIGDVSSEGHVTALHNVAAENLADFSVDLQLTPAAALPAGWSLVTEQALRASGLLQAGRMLINTKAVIIRGYYADKAQWQAAMRRLHTTLLTGMQLQDETIAQTVSAEFIQQCQRQFDAALRGRQVSFHFNKATLRSAAFPLLDAIVQIAADCADAQITITGHTDASGDADSNQQLSERRARAVLDYLTAHGIEPSRLRALGAGAVRRLDESGTPAARARNRRIEFAFTFPASD